MTVIVSLKENDRNIFNFTNKYLLTSLVHCAILGETYEAYVCYVTVARYCNCLCLAMVLVLFPGYFLFPLILASATSSSPIREEYL